MQLARPTIAALAAALVTALAPVAAHAQGAAQRASVRIVVPYGSGGVPDVLARLIAHKMSDSLGQPVIVDNRPGASGIIAAEHVKGSPPDGSALWLADSGHLAISPVLRERLPYHPVRDFTPVAHLVYSPFFIYANTALQVQSAKDLVALVKARPGTNYGSSGNGSPHHLCMALFANSAGVQMTHIPYKGVAQSIPALSAGDFNVICSSPLAVDALVKSGKTRVLAVASARRSPVMPDVPTLAESGMPNVEVGASIGLLLPAGASGDVVQRLARASIAAVAQPDVSARLTTLGQEIITEGPEQYAERIRTELQRYERSVRISGAKVD